MNFTSSSSWHSPQKLPMWRHCKSIHEFVMLSILRFQSIKVGLLWLSLSEPRRTPALACPKSFYRWRDTCNKKSKFCGRKTLCPHSFNFGIPGDWGKWANFYTHLERWPRISVSNMFGLGIHSVLYKIILTTWYERIPSFQVCDHRSRSRAAGSIIYCGNGTWEGA